MAAAYAKWAYQQDPQRKFIVLNPNAWLEGDFSKSFFTIEDKDFRIGSNISKDEGGIWSMTTAEFTNTPVDILKNATVIIDEVDQVLSGGKTAALMGNIDVVIGLTASLGAQIGSQILKNKLDMTKFIFWEYIDKTGMTPFKPDELNVTSYELEPKPFTETSLAESARKLVELIRGRRGHPNMSQPTLILVEDKNKRNKTAQAINEELKKKYLADIEKVIAFDAEPTKATTRYLMKLMSQLSPTECQTIGKI